MHPLFTSTAYKILEQFLHFPTTDFSVRGLSRKCGISHATVLNYIATLEEQGLIERHDGLYPSYRARSLDASFLFYKKEWILFQILTSGIIKHLEKATLPSSIILFGSCAKGTFTEKSDIDIFIEAAPIKLSLEPFEKQLQRKINVLFEPRIENLSEKLGFNIINGTCLHGFIKLRCRNESNDDVEGLPRKENSHTKHS